jgi:hypothetical protein
MAYSWKRIWPIVPIPPVNALLVFGGDIPGWIGIGENSFRAAVFVPTLPGDSKRHQATAAPGSA